jgi:hypothetical protein
MDASDRKSVQTAADSIDEELRQSPNGVGESRAAGTRILTIAPLSVYYDVHEADRTVFVWSVWPSRRC